ncbi:MAG TPA: hypothetical protein VF746_15075 [Longimicrobium sp.]|jgi:hypothetical protein
MKKKLSLDPAELRVESFETRSAAAEPKGTVRAHEVTEYTCGQPAPTSDPDACTALVLRPTRIEMTVCVPCCV